jgi:putative ABC transport system permease protein
MFWDIALRNLWQRRLRSVLTILGVAMALQLNLTLNNLMGRFGQDVQRQFSFFAGKLFVQQAMPAGGTGWDTFPSLSSSIAIETAAGLLTRDHVDQPSSSAVLFVQLVAPIIPTTPPELMAVGIEPGHEAAFLGTVEAEDGRVTLTAPDEVILGQGAAGYYQPEGSDSPVRAGQTVEIQGHPFTVVGVLEKSSALFGGAVLMPLSTAQDLLNRPDTASAVILTATRVEDVADLKATVEAQFPDLQATSQDELIESASSMLALMGVFFSMMNRTALAVVVIVIAIVMIVAVLEQRRDIGTLRAIGARRRTIFGMVAIESLAISLAGALVALPLSALANWAFWRYPVGPDIVVVWTRALGLSVALGVLASLLPAWQAVRVEPLEALRYE